MILSAKCGRATGSRAALFQCPGRWPCSVHTAGRAGAISERGSGTGAAMNKSPEIEEFYVSWKWRRFRESRISMAGGLCEECQRRGIVTPADDVHHIIELTPQNVNDPAISLSVENTLVLCEKCHAEKHKKRRWRCDAFGHVAL